MNEHLERKKLHILITVDSCLGGYSNCVSAHLNDGRIPVCDFRLSKVALITCD